MAENPNQPQEYDSEVLRTSAVLGGTASASTDKVILGGIEGVKWRLGIGNLSNHPYSIDQKIAALKDALNYGQAGLELVIQALKNESWQIHQAAYVLLEKYAKTKTEPALVQYSSRLAKELIKCYDAGERNFMGTHLSQAYLPWVELSEINLSQANLSEAYLNRANLSGADLSEANLSKVNLISGDLSEANLNGANLSQAYMHRADLSGASLIGANLRGTDLSQADLSGANLSGANLSEVTLSWANLSEANLSRANLSRANLVGAKFTSLDLSEANLSGAKLTGVNLNEANLVGAYYNDETDFPIGFTSYGQIKKLPQ